MPSTSIRVNGEHRHVEGGIRPPSRCGNSSGSTRVVAVERNLEIIPRSTFDTVCVEDGDDYEIVHFVGGG